jgi:hypothetical protein
MDSKLPSNKWLAALVTSIGGLLTALIQNQWQLSIEMQILIVGIVVQAIVTYLVPNSPVLHPRSQ